MIGFGTHRCKSRIKSVTTQLNDILKEIESGNGDLTRRISLKNKDEIGQLAGGINVFLETLQQIMSPYCD